jgi:hypothetical protein
MTSAARIIKLELIPQAIADIVWMEQGVMIIPLDRKDPLAKGAAMSSRGHE